MYSRNYNTDDTTALRVPENYDGTAFSEAVTEAEPPDTVVASEPEQSDESASVSPVSNIFSGLGKMPIFSGIFGEGSALGNISLKLPKIGTEEILIIAAAAYLFFSKDGDRECAIILLLTLLIS